MIRGKINLNNYGLIHEYIPSLGRWYYVAFAIPIIVIMLAITYFYGVIHLSINPEYPDFINIVFNPIILAGMFILLLIAALSTGTGKVLIFQEGIYIDPGPGGMRDQARRNGFIPWADVRIIVRTPYKNGGMSVIGLGPYDEVILPGRLHPRFDEIQDEILHIRPASGVKIIDLRDIASFPLGEYGSPIQGLWGLAPAIPAVAGLVKLVRTDISIAVREFAGGEGSIDNTVLLLPVITGGILILLVLFTFIAFRSGRFAMRFAVYKDGLLIHMMGVASFARWDEIQAIEKIKLGQYKLVPVDERVRPSILNVGKSGAADFERVMKRLGRLVG